MDLGMKGLKALVTGSTRGLGYATAQALAREGAIVSINGRDAGNLEKANEALRKEAGQQIYAIMGDVSSAETCTKVVDQSAKAMQGMDLLVTNAGGPPLGKFETFDEETWQKAINLSFLSHVWLIKAALPHLRHSKAASVLTVTSVSVKQPIPNLILSNSIRSATIGLTKSLALELGADGIRFNSILPSWTETERVTDLLSTRARTNGTSLDEEKIKQSKESPFGRMARPEEFANVALFLLSPAASYVTGVMLSVDGGMYKGLF
jgi:3-oxoacyl-[acyl-carrier protein] reductase